MDQNELSDVWLLPEADTGSQSNISVDLSYIYPCIYLFSLSDGKKLLTYQNQGMLNYDKKDSHDYFGQVLFQKYKISLS